MKDADYYTLQIEAYTPETIPMARLVKYLGALATLFGEEKSVHFQGMTSGSTQLACVVEREAAYAVAVRIEEAPSASAKTSVGRAYRNIRHLLLEDSAGARLSRNAQNILIFPRVDRNEAGTITLYRQKIARVGTLVGIGGRDATAHATLQNTEGTHWSFAVDRTLAKRLSAYLYSSPLRLIGEGKRTRDEHGEWREEDLKATHFEVLEGRMGWPEMVKALRESTIGWPEDTMETLTALREDD